MIDHHDTNIVFQQYYFVMIQMRELTQLSTVYSCNYLFSLL